MNTKQKILTIGLSTIAGAALGTIMIPVHITIGILNVVSSPANPVFYAAVGAYAGWRETKKK